MVKCDVVVVCQVYFFFSGIIYHYIPKQRFANRHVTLGLSSSSQACCCHGTAKLPVSQFPPRSHETALKFQQSEPLDPDNLFSRCPVMVLFEFPITVERNKSILTYSQLFLNTFLAVKKGCLVQSRLYTNAVSFFGSQVLMVISGCDLGTIFESKASQISVSYQSRHELQDCILVDFPFQYL